MHPAAVPVLECHSAFCYDQHLQVEGSSQRPPRLLHLTLGIVRTSACKSFHSHHSCFLPHLIITLLHNTNLQSQCKQAISIPWTFTAQPSQIALSLPSQPTGSRHAQ